MFGDSGSVHLRVNEMTKRKLQNDFPEEGKNLSGVCAALRSWRSAVKYFFFCIKFSSSTRNFEFED